MSSITPSDNHKVNEIVDRLKKQGLFDQFRKDCLADVDTKPAYLNLRHRVEVAVNSFLSVYKWRPDLNKNSIRESVRKHINESQMLSTGVDHIIEQVVNPKVHNTFKPAIDQVVCECLGIDLKEWEAKIHLKEELKLRGQTMGKDPTQSTGIPSLFDIPVGSTIAETSTNNIISVSSYQQSGGIYQSPYGSFSQPGYPQGTPGYQFPGILPYTGQAQIPGMPGFDMNAALGLPSAANTDLNQQPPNDLSIDATTNTDQDKDNNTNRDKKKKEKKKLEPLTVEDLLNIPLPKDDTKPDKAKHKKEDELVYETSEYSQVEQTVVMDSTYDDTMENVVTEGEYSQDEQVITTTEGYPTDLVEDNQGDQPKVYHFAWQDLEFDQEVTVSSDNEVMDL